MKRFALVTGAILICILGYTVLSGKSEGAKGGIQFYEGSWEQTLKKAAAENKPIFMDIYATWCGPCKMLKKKTFANKAAGTYFNANYISVSFDGENGDGVMLANKFHITGYPTLIILSKTGELINLQTGYVDADELVTFGKQSYRK